MDRKMLVFEEATHRYFLDGVELPSVTSVLTDEGHRSSFSDDEWCAEFGRAAHYMIRLDLEGCLDDASVQDILKPTLKAWRKWRKDHPLSPLTNMNGLLLAEKPIYHSVYRYAGTPDLPMTDGKDIYMVDLKNSVSKQPYWHLQTRAYGEALREEMIIPTKTKIHDYALMIPRGSEEYRFEHLDDPGAWSAWVGTLNSWKWKHKYNLHRKAA